MGLTVVRGLNGALALAHLRHPRTAGVFAALCLVCATVQHLLGHTASF
jgi:hypothetical protein